MTILSESNDLKSYSHGSVGAHIYATVTTTDELQWLVFDSPSPMLVNSYEAINTGDESIDVTVVRSRYSLAQLGGDIDPTDSRVTTVVDGEANASGAAPVTDVDNETHPRLIAIGVVSTGSETPSVGVLLNLGVSV